MQKTKYITKEIREMLPGIIKEKNLNIKDFVKIVNYETETDLNDEVIKDLDLADLIKRPKNNQCWFFEGNKAKIVQLNETERFAYVSISDDNKGFCLTLQDFFIAFKDNNYGLGISEMMDAYGYNTEEERTKERFRDVYRKNLHMLEDNTWSKDYPVLYGAIRTSIEIFKALNEIALMNVNKERDNANGEHLFFCSSRYLAEYMTSIEETSSDNINKVINFLTLLGFMKKVKEEDIPEHYKSNASYQKDRRMTSNYYIINLITDEILRQAEDKLVYISNFHKKINILRPPNNRITKLTKDLITEAKVTQYFGKEEAEKIFPNDEYLKEVIRIGKNERYERNRLKKKLLKKQPMPY